ncbi:MAG: hypothetical protein JSR85_03850 [Proteobacteria bacterium]|nr:hypothetical protein [Pseudomonadota bacterium]
MKTLNLTLALLALTIGTASIAKPHMSTAAVEKTHEQQMKDICNKHTVGQNENVDKACEALGCGLYSIPQCS